jgi:predicted RNA binding protein YcfA (HicA-like mRNA interferase family)
MKVSEIIRLLEFDGWTLKRTTGSHGHYTHPTQPGLVTVAGKPSATLKPKTETSIHETGRVLRDTQHEHDPSLAMRTICG